MAPALQNTKAQGRGWKGLQAPPWPFLPWAEVGAAHGRQLLQGPRQPPLTARVRLADTAVCNSRYCRHRTSTKSCDLPADVLCRAQTHVPAAPLCLWAQLQSLLPVLSPHGLPRPPAQPGTGSPSLWAHAGLMTQKLCLRGEERRQPPCGR